MRLANHQDEQAVWALVRRAYEHYVPRVGGEPGPMRTDYAAAIAEGAVWVEADPDLVGVLVRAPSRATCCSRTSPYVRMPRAGASAGP